MDTSLRPRWEDNLRLFHSQHPSGSKYHNQAYTGRSKLFRPKTRAHIKNQESALAAALFSNGDDLMISAHNQNSAEAAATAKLVQALVQYRLTHTIPWFLTALGCWQDTHVHGICVSRQEWQYEVQNIDHYDVELDDDNNPVTDGEGNILGTRTRTRKVVKDRPWMHHVKPEHFHFDYNCDWRNPVGTSDVIIEEIPMTAMAVMEMMEKEDTKTGKPVWEPQELATILTHGSPRRTQDATTQQARAGDKRTNPQDMFTGDQYSTVYVRLNLIHEDGTDYVFYSLGDSVMLTEPKPCEELFAHGRPWAVGVSNLEAHRTVPSSSIEMGAPLQEGINEITNQRRDNVGLALNKRYFIKRQKQGAIDLKALMRNVAGGGVMVDDPSDVKVIETNDVTASSYTEQDRLSVEMDELLGNFSQGSVMNNRKLNESVGGMNLMSSGANAVQELAIQLFIKTWAEPVLRQLAILEQKYETDEVILHIAGENAGILQQNREQNLVDTLTEDDLIVKVNIGMGNTNPAFKVEKLSMALNTIAQWPDLMAKIDADEVGKEMFGFVGYSDGGRFFKKEDPNAPPAEPAPDPAAEAAAAQAQLEREKFEYQQQKDAAEAEFNKEKFYAELQLREKLEFARMELEFEKESQKDKTIRETAALRENNKATETLLKHREETPETPQIPAPKANA